MMNLTRKQLALIVGIALVFGSLGSILVNRYALPFLSNLPGLGWIERWQSNSPIVITRREEVRLNEGVNLIELTKQAQTVTVSIYHPTGTQALGNGVVITSDGLIFSTKEVVGSHPAVRVVLNDGRVFEGLVRALDPKSPLAAITIQAQDLAVAQFSDAGNLQTAQRVFALGLTNREFTREMASGLVTKTLANNLDADRVLSTEAFEHTFRTDADLTGEYLGGPVVNLQGLVVGIVAASSGQILPAEAVDGAIKSYLETGKIQRQYFGLQYVMLTANSAKIRSLPSAGGLVAATAAGSPAAESGLRPNDLIVKVNGQPVGESTLEQLLVRHGGGEMRLEVIRGGEQLELALTPEIR